MPTGSHSHRRRHAACAAARAALRPPRCTPVVPAAPAPPSALCSTSSGGSPGELDSLHKALKASGTDNVMRQSAAHLLTAVANLDAAAHSLGCLYLL